MLTKTTMKQIRLDIEEALNAVAQKHGIKFTPGNATFSADSFRMKLEANVVQANGTVETKEAKAFKREAYRFGLKPEMLGKRLMTKCGTELTITGLNTRAYANPVCAVGVNGKTFKMPAGTVLSGTFV